jgi:hypothetical protein
MYGLQAARMTSAIKTRNGFIGAPPRKLIGESGALKAFRILSDPGKI